MAKDMSTQGQVGLSNANLSVTQPNGGGALGEQYAADPASAFPAADKTTQGPAGTTDTMVNSIESTRAFGAGK
jgi:hypothetical protein